MKLLVVGCASCGSITAALGGICERCALERGGDRRRAGARRIRIRRSLPRKRAA